MEKSNATVKQKEESFLSPSFLGLLQARFEKKYIKEAESEHFAFLSFSLALKIQHVH